MDKRKIGGTAKSKTVVLVTPTVRARQFKPGTFHVTGDLLFCSTCNVPVDFIRKDSCTKHLDNNVHKRKAANVKSNESHEAKKQKLQASIFEVFAKETAQKQLEIMRLEEVFSSVNVPLHVLDDANLKAYLETNLKVIGVIPSAHQLRQ